MSSCPARRRKPAANPAKSKISTVQAVQDKRNQGEQADADVPRQAAFDGIKIRWAERCPSSRSVAIFTERQSRQIICSRTWSKDQIQDRDNQPARPSGAERRSNRSHDISRPFIARW